MALFDQIMGALDNPNQQANTSQLGSILGAVQQISQQKGVDVSTTQTVMSMLGGYVRSSLNQKRSSNNLGSAEALISQFAGTNSNPAAVQALFPHAQQNQIAQEIANRTGLDAGTVQTMMTVLVPIVLNLLSTGASQQQSNTPTSGNSNNVLGAFLDSDQDGDVDLGDTLAMAGRFLNQNR